MESVPRNVILDLLPAYIAGEASRESRAIIEEFAENDTQIAEIIRTGKLDPVPISRKISVPDDLEMKTIKLVRKSIRRRMWYVALATAAVLMAPLMAMQFTDEVNWGIFDFVVMGILLFSTGLIYALISRNSESTAYRTGVGVAVAAGLLLIWVNLAVGIIGSEDNTANLMYGGVLVIGVIGASISRFKPYGMSLTMFAVAFAQLLVPVIAQIIWRPSMELTPGVIGVYILNAFFAMLFAVSGFLFRSAARKENPL